MRQNPDATEQSYQQPQQPEPNTYAPQAQPAPQQYQYQEPQQQYQYQQPQQQYAHQTPLRASPTATLSPLRRSSRLRPLSLPCHMAIHRRSSHIDIPTAIRMASASGSAATIAATRTWVATTGATPPFAEASRSEATSAGIAASLSLRDFSLMTCVQ